jgi:hypothetical protein
MSPENIGFYEKFEVRRKDGRDRTGGDRQDAIYFTLDLTHDRFARIALQAYADAAADDLPELVADLRHRGFIT